METTEETKKMSGTVYTIAQNTVPILEFSIPTAKMIRNNDTMVTIYVDNNRGVNSSRGFPLPPGSTKILEPGDVCFAVCGGTDTATLTVSDLAGPLWDPAAIAAQLNINGIPLIDDPQIIAADTWSSPAAFATHTVLNTSGGGTMDISKFQTIVLYAWAKETATTTVPPAYGYGLLRFWAGGLSGTMLLQESFDFLGDNNLASSFPGSYPIGIFPAIGDTLQYFVGWQTSGITMLAGVTGSYRPEPKRVLNSHGYWGRGAAANSARRIDT